MRNSTKLLRVFLNRIVEARFYQTAMEEVFYGEDGIDMAFQRDEISWEDHQLLLQVIGLMYER